MKQLTHEMLLSLLVYYPDEGVFRWRVARPGRWNIKPGDIAGTPHVRGYVTISLFGKNYLAHRLAIFYVSGKWPEHQVDHRFGNKSKAILSELRVVPNEINAQNIRFARKNNKLGVLGVTKNGRRFTARVTTNRVATLLGQFDTPEEAHAAYVSVKRMLHEGCTI